MLVIRRRGGQSLTIGGDIQIQVVEVSGGRVKLAIQAPPHVAIARSEVLLASEENRRAAASRWGAPLEALAAKLRNTPQAAAAAADMSCERGSPGAAAAGPAGGRDTTQNRM